LYGTRAASLWKLPGTMECSSVELSIENVSRMKEAVWIYADGFFFF
jgi:hypothetical protein